jgi:hypothetical protein
VRHMLKSWAARSARRLSLWQTIAHVSSHHDHDHGPQLTAHDPLPLQDARPRSRLQLQTQPTPLPPPLPPPPSPPSTELGLLGFVNYLTSNPASYFSGLFGSNMIEITQDHVAKLWWFLLAAHAAVSQLRGASERRRTHGSAVHGLNL